MATATDDTSGFWRPSTVVASVVLLVILLLAGWLVFASGGSSGHSASKTPSPSPTSVVMQGSSSTESPTPSSRCHLSDSDQTVPQMTPQGITWELYQTVALPFSATAGPAVIEGDIARCYAHTPLGALLAASQIEYRYLIAPNWRAVNLQQVVPNAGRDTFTKQREELGNTGSNQPGDFEQLAGFKFVTYSPAVAVVELASKSDTGAMQAGAVTVDWLDGDWKLQLQPDGSSSASELPLASLVGFATWSGV